MSAFMRAWAWALVGASLVMAGLFLAARRRYSLAAAGASSPARAPEPEPELDTLPSPAPRARRRHPAEPTHGE